MGKPITHLFQKAQKEITQGPWAAKSSENEGEGEGEEEEEVRVYKEKFTVGYEADMWAVGCLVYNLITGSPFQYAHSV